MLYISVGNIRKRNIGIGYNQTFLITLHANGDVDLGGHATDLFIGCGINELESFVLFSQTMANAFAVFILGSGGVKQLR